VLQARSKAALNTVIKREAEITVIGRLTTLEAILGWLDQHYTQAKQAVLRYYYLDDRGSADNVTVILDTPQPVYPEYYPNMVPDPMTVFRKFLASSNQLLFLSGVPGTGKTSFLRAAVYENGLKAAVAYDQTLLKKDNLFVNFLTEEDDDVLIFEDAELLITGREYDGNKLVTKFLNITDGIIKSSHKKMIFTTNSWKINQIDPALLRVGRCFGVMQFTTMNHEQAVQAAIRGGLPIPPPGKAEYTLAELFNQDLTAWQGQRFGF
jgi:hypothetical protein